jgi:dipeptidyl aminopeptidase/acylaminoacyl peptidase
MIEGVRTGLNADPRITLTRSLPTMLLALARTAWLTCNWWVNAEAASACEAQPATTNQARDSTAGGWIAFTSNRDGNHEIYAMRDDRGQPRRLTHHAAADFWPTWSSDGERIAFVSDRDGNDEIYVMDADGSNVHVSLTTRRKTPIPHGRQTGRESRSPRVVTVTWRST